MNDDKKFNPHGVESRTALNFDACEIPDDESEGDFTDDQFLVIANLSKEERTKFAGILKQWFPWLDSDDDCSGADTVDEICELHTMLTGKE